MTRPRILLTWSRSATRPPDRYLEAITAAGGDPVIALPEDGNAALADADGLVLTGGRDIHPSHYGQEVEESVADTLSLDERRDRFEAEAIAFAVEHGLPILGICRGIQVLNVALGGTLVQDLSLCRVDPATHDQRRRTPEPPAEEPVHTAALTPGSLLGRILGEPEVPVNSYHHQAVDEPAPRLRVSARAPDGTVEAVEAADLPFVVGVQWHPERMVPGDPRQRKLFAAFVAAARSRRPPE